MKMTMWYGRGGTEFWRHEVDAWMRTRHHRMMGHLARYPTSQIFIKSRWKVAPTDHTHVQTESEQNILLQQETTAPGQFKTVTALTHTSRPI